MINDVPKESKYDPLPPSSDKEFWGEDAEITLIDTNKPEAEFKAKEGHIWKQRGAYIICSSCPLMHSVYIGVSKHLVGYDEKGRPRFKKVVLSPKK